MARTREFDEAQALDAAIKVFWRAGYDGTSMDMLTEATGVGKPSLYAAFGNKRALYSKAVGRYAELFAPKLHRAMSMPTAKEAVRAYWEFFVQGAREVPGCFLVQSAQACSSEDVCQESASRRLEAEAVIAHRLAQARKTGELPASARPTDLARYVTTVANGLSVQGASGVSVADRKRTAELALMVFGG